MSVLHARRPPRASVPEPRRSPEALEPYLEDASGAPAGRAAGLLRVTDEPTAAAWLRATLEAGTPVLPQAARSSLTGGAIPHGEVVLGVERLDGLGAVERHPGGARVTVGAGVRLRDLQEHVGRAGFYYPPVPTHQEAMIGGSVSTNAGGAATFKYGVTRDWVHGLRVLLANGDLLVLERGLATARRGAAFAIALSDGTRIDVPAPDHHLPAVRKISAGYYADDPLDLVDLFVGSEGTLGLITAVTVDLVPRPPSVVGGLVFSPSPGRAFALAAALRRAAAGAREASDRAGPDVRSIEWLDAGCLEILRRHDDVRRRRVHLPDDARAGVLFEMELDEPADDARVQERLAAALNGGAGRRDDGLLRMARLVREHGALETLELAFPQDAARHRALAELREAVPQRVGEMLARRPGVSKVAGDPIVPFEELESMMRIYREGFERRGLDYAVWGHLADGNLHPNALPRTPAEVEAAGEVILEFGAEAARRGGCPLSEHGVGRHPLKQRLLTRFLGRAAIERMRLVKRALDPTWRLAPGVLFPVP